MSVSGYVMNIQPFSVNDGDGIRTTVFLAGCPLRCGWCSNPEGFTCVQKVGWHQRKCIGCGACTEVCTQGIGIDMNAERTRCVACGACVDACPTGARTGLVTLMDAEDILTEIQKHRLFYSYSGGGVTFSGGEATSQTEFLDYLSSRIYDMGFSMDIETCGMFDWDSVEPILRRMDLIFMDLKHMDPDVHKQYTGVSNETILRNIANLSLLRSPAGTGGEIGAGAAEHGPDIVIRIPVIGGVNDDEKNIRQSAEYVHRHLPYARMELLPYHKLGTVKYQALGLPYIHPEFSVPDKKQMERLRAVVAEAGVELADFR